MKTIKFIIFYFALTLSVSATAQNQTATVGEATKIKINIVDTVAGNKCNIEVTLPNQQKMGIEVEGPQFVASFDFTPSQTGSNIINWEGKNKFRGFNSVFACPGSGTIQVNAGSQNEEVAKRGAVVLPQLQTSQSSQGNTVLASSERGSKPPLLYFGKTNVEKNMRDVFANVMTREEKYDIAANFVYANNIIVRLTKQIGTFVRPVDAYNKNMPVMKAGLKRYFDVFDSLAASLGVSRVLVMQEFNINIADNGLAFVTDSNRNPHYMDNQVIDYIWYFGGDQNYGSKLSTYYKIRPPNVLYTSEVQEVIKKIELPFQRVLENATRVDNQLLAIENQKRIREKEAAIQREEMAKRGAVILPQTDQYAYISNLSARRIREQIINHALTKEQVEGFQFNLGFANSFYARMSSPPDRISKYSGYYNYIAFLPLKSPIDKINQGFKSFFKKIADTLNVKESVIYSAFGFPTLEYIQDHDGKVERKFIDGRLMATQYWLKYPIEDVPRNVNDWYNTKTPEELFLDFYPILLDSYMDELPKLFNIASILNRQLEKNVKDAEIAQAKRIDEKRQKEQFLNSPEGKKQVAVEKAEELQRQIKFAKEFPYYAEITCSHGYGSSFQIYACFGGRVPTSIELRNGKEYNLYTQIELMTTPAFIGENVRINLREKFSIKMQNSDESLVLGLKIIKRTSDEIIFQKKATQFGVISVRN